MKTEDKFPQNKHGTDIAILANALSAILSPFLLKGRSGPASRLSCSAKSQ